MRIGIDIRLFNESGNGRYIRNILREISKVDWQNFYVLYGLAADQEDVAKLLNFSEMHYIYKVVDARWYTLKEQLLLPYLLYRDSLDLVHFPHFNVPLLYRKPFVVTIHDLTHFHFAMKRASTLPGWLYTLKQAAYKKVFTHAVYGSRSIITVSNYVKKEILERFSVAADKISVIYEAADALPAVDGSFDRVSQKFSITKPYFFYIGNAHPHKNIEFMIAAFQKFNTEGKYQLVLAGKKSYFWQQIEEQTSDKNISFVGFLTEEELAAFYKNAIAYIFPSLSEGFGLPVLEAMSYGCPVICAERTSLPEIAGKAAYYINPDNDQSLMTGFAALSSDSGLRSQLIEEGFRQVAKYSWATAAKATLEIYSR